LRHVSLMVFLPVPGGIALRAGFRFNFNIFEHPRSPHLKVLDIVPLNPGAAGARIGRWLPWLWFS
jgi:hypothetical protein